MATSSIEWTELTWNPTTGCDKVSPGCRYCYAEAMTRRLKAMGVEKYRDGFELRTHESALAIPFQWRKPALVFVNSMSDLFHPDVPLDFIRRVFRVMADCPHLTFSFFFFKQWGGRNKKAAGRELEGEIHDALPTPKNRSRRMSA